MKVTNLLLAAMFLVFAFVQVDDPDPVLWILVYGAVAISCVLAAFKVFYPRVSLVFALLLAAHATTLSSGVREWLAQDDPSMLFDDVAKMEYLFVEEAREFLGLLICIIVLAVHIFQSRRFTPRRFK